MAYKMKKDLAHTSNYGSKRSLSDIKYIVIHYTSNDGDTDEANCNYYNGANRKASAHYFVDDDSVSQSVPDDYVAWSVGGSKYSNCKTTGGGSLHGKCTNSNSLSIEICDDVRNGKVYPSDATIENVLELTRTLMKKYNIPASRVIRHFDVTGKSCPAYWCGTDTKNKKWKTEFWDKLDDVPKKEEPKKTETVKKTVTATTTANKFLKSLAGTYKVTASSLNVRHGAGVTKKVMVAIPKNKEVDCYGYYTTALGTKWLYVQFTHEGVKYTGFASSKYLKK